MGAVAYIAPFKTLETMYNKRPGSYDEIPEGMKRYINNYGCHFNKKLCEEAVDRMYTKDDNTDKKVHIKPYTKEQIEQLLKTHGIELERNKMYDATYIANMCKADYLGRSVPTEKHLAMFIKDAVDDPDAVSGMIFNRWYADQMFMDNPVDWEEFI